MERNGEENLNKLVANISQKQTFSENVVSDACNWIWKYEKVSVSKLAYQHLHITSCRANLTNIYLKPAFWWKTYLDQHFSLLIGCINLALRRTYDVVSGSYAWLNSENYLISICIPFLLNDKKRNNFRSVEYFRRVCI